MSTKNIWGESAWVTRLHPIKRPAQTPPPVGRVKSSLRNQRRRPNAWKVKVVA